MQVEIPDELYEMCLAETTQNDPEKVVCEHLVIRLAQMRGREEASRLEERHVDHRYIADERKKIINELDSELWDRKLGVLEARGEEE